ncbi:MAG: histidine triad nucleotide-binding protein [Nitrospirae bacterium]|nr:histidine triad nucleotide-binding protein [Nitrospirota bacterium]
MENQDCIFCKVIRGEMKTEIQYQDEHVVAIKDIRPQAPVHLLLVPKRHISTLLSVKDSDQALLSHIFQTANEIARKGGFADNGFRIVINCNPNGGQTVYHLHVHLLGGRFMTWPPG